MMIPVSEPLITESDARAVQQALSEGWVSGEGPYVERFEREFAQALGVRHAIAVANGTAAIDVTFEALSLKPGDEVIMPAFTIISCALQVVRAGAVPVLVDSSATDWNMSVEQVNDKLSDRTKAVLAVHTYGLPVDLDPVLNECSSRGVPVVEDAAEAHGLRYKGRPCGAIGLAGTFSFYSNKTLTTGEGGMVVTDHDELATNVRLLRNLAFRPERRFVHDRLGWNLRMTSMQAALGTSQLGRLDEAVERKRRIGAQYRKRLASIPDITFAPSETEFARNSYWVVGLVLGESHPSADEVRRRLNEAGVGTRPFFCPLHLQPVFRNMGLFAEDSHQVAERLWERGLYLPSGLALTDDQIEIVCSRLIEVLA